MAITQQLDNPYLRGAWEPVDTERDDTLTVSGTLPEGLRGSFVRNGPNVQFDPPGRYHLFDGDGMLHAITLGDGPPRYRNRWVRTPGFELERERGVAVYGGMAEAVPVDHEAQQRAGGMKNVANTNVIPYQNDLLALWEAGTATRVARDLQTIGEETFGGTITGALTAHPKLDVRTNELFAFGYSPLPPFLSSYRIDPKLNIAEHGSVPIARPVMMHDFAITEEDLVFLDAPGVFTLEAYIEGGPLLQWLPEHGARFHLLPRNGGPAHTYEIDPCYVFHFFNAFRHGEYVIVDAARLDHLELGLETDPTTPVPPVSSATTRWIINTETAEVSERVLDTVPSDFPRIDDRRQGVVHRVGFAAANAGSDSLRGDFDALLRLETDPTRPLDTPVDRQMWVAPEGCVLGEPLPVAAPDGEEREGWVLIYEHNVPEHRTDLLVFTADAVEAGPIARVHTNTWVPAGFHGSWIPSA